MQFSKTRTQREDEADEEGERVGNERCLAALNRFYKSVNYAAESWSNT